MVTKRERLGRACIQLGNLAAQRRGRPVPALICGEHQSGANMRLGRFRHSLRTAVHNEADDETLIDCELHGLSLITSPAPRSPASRMAFVPTPDGTRASDRRDALPGSRGTWMRPRHEDAIASAPAMLGETWAAVARTFDHVGHLVEDRIVARVFGSHGGREPNPHPGVDATCDSEATRLRPRHATPATTGSLFAEGSRA